MNDIDRNLETVLRGLREAQPDASLELRITQALREAHEEAAVSWWRSWWVGLGVAGAVAVCAIFAILLRPERVRKSTDVSLVAPTLRSVVKQPSPAVPKDLPSPGRVLVHREVRAVVAQRTGADNPQLEDFPAPPLPLTEQERLLIRLAHRDDPVQLARLGPGPRDDRYQAEKDQVSEFFTPPAPLVSPDTSSTESGGGTQ